MLDKYVSAFTLYGDSIGSSVMLYGSSHSCDCLVTLNPQSSNLIYAIRLFSINLWDWYRSIQHPLAGTDIAVGWGGLKPPPLPLIPWSLSKFFCHGCFKEKMLEIEDDDFNPLNFHSRSVTIHLIMSVHESWRWSLEYFLLRSSQNKCRYEFCAGQTFLILTIFI